MANAQDMQESGPMAWTGIFNLTIFWLAVASLGAVSYFWSGLISLGEAWTRPEYSYGPMVPLITAYMSLREVQRRPVVMTDESRLPGVLVFLGGLLISLIGNLSEIPDFVTYGFIVAVGGIILIIAGTRAGLRFWPGWLHLFFMLPLPNIVYWQVSTTLQFISSELGVEFIKLAGVPVFLDGNVIDLGSYQLLVAEACSGLRYLFPLLSFGWLFAVLYNGPNWHRVVLFFSTIPITIFMNSFRIGMIGVLVNYFGIGQAEGFLHSFEGWIIFLTCTLMLYAEAWLLNRFFSGRNRAPHMLDIDFQGIMQPLRRLAVLPAHRMLMAAALVLVVAGVVWQAQSGTAAGPVERSSFRSFPLEIGGWRGEPELLEESIENVLKADDYFLAAYSQGPQTVSLFLTFYERQTGGKGIHSPEVCLPSGGWEVSNWKQRDVPVGGAGRTIPVNRAVIQRGLSRQLVYYWFEQRGRQMTSDYSAKLSSIWDRMAIGRSDGGLVRLVTPIGENEDPARADARLTEFMNGVVPELDAHFPPRSVRAKAE